MSLQGRPFESFVSRWGIPILFLLHNVEESFGMTAFLDSQLGVSFISQRQFTAAIVLLTVSVFVLVWFFRKRTAFLLFVQGAIFFNAVQHVVLLLVLKQYNPGLVSACIIIVLFFAFLSFIRPFLEKKTIRIVLLGSLLAYPVVTWTALWIGGFL